MEIQLFQAIGQSLMTHGAADQAECILVQALELAELNEGPQSTLAGLLLLDLLDLYDREQREIESAKVWQRIRQIILCGLSNGRAAPIIEN